MQRLAAVPLRTWATLALAAAVLSCSDSGGPTRPPHSNTPTGSPTLPAKPVITRSTDSVGATALAGAAAADYTVAIGAGDTTTVRGLTAMTAVADGDAGWLSTQLDDTVAPAKLTVHLDPRSASVGVHTATITVAATAANAKTLRVQLTVRARPVLLLDSTTRGVTANIGDSIPALSLSIRSSSDTIGMLSLGTPVCDDHAWIGASLTGVATPATVTLAVNPAGLAAGTFVCRIDVRSTQALVDSATRTIVVSLTLRQAPRIAFDQSSVGQTLQAGTSGAASVVHITNSGSGVLDGLSIGTIGLNGPSGWLTATLDGSTAPTTLRLSSSAQSLPPGTYIATIPIQSTAAGVRNSPAAVSLTLTVSPKPYLFTISPSAISISYSISTAKSTTATVSFYDANASGQTASFVHFVGTGLTNVSGTCPSFAYGGPNVNSPVLPQVYTFMVNAFGAPVGSCTYTMLAQLTNGQSGTLSITVSVVP